MAKLVDDRKRVEVNYRRKGGHLAFWLRKMADEDKIPVNEFIDNLVYEEYYRRKQNA